jgi:NAD(P)-dependent dehydrogenase (short-subunit alcohol dehydrogenase family)
MSKIAVITGASRGLGKHIAGQLVSEGFKVYILCRSTSAGEEAKKGFSNPQLAAVVQCDVADIKSIEQACSHIASKESHIDVLINNAAIGIDGNAAICSLELEQYRQTMDTNVLGLIWMCKQMLPLLRLSADARIINFSSGLGMLSVPRMGPLPSYSISKTAVNAVTKILSHEEAGSGVCVVSVDPGWVKTDMGGPDAQLEISEGIDTPVWLATTERCNIQTGNFYKERNILPW